MQTICKRAEKKLKELIDCENFIKNKKVWKFYSRKNINSWLNGKKELDTVFDLAFRIEKGNPLANTKKKKREIVSKIQKYSIYDMFKKSCEYYLSMPNKKEITEIIFKKAWNEWFHNRGLTSLHVYTGLKYEEIIEIKGAKQNKHKKFTRDSFLIGINLDADIINELFNSKFLMQFDTKKLLPDDGTFSINSITYSHLFIFQNEINNKEPENKFLVLSPEVINYFKDKRRNNQLPWIASTLSIISVCASIITPIIYHYVK